MKLMGWTCWGPSPGGEPLVSIRKFLFLIIFLQPMMKPILRLEQDKLVNIQRIEKGNLGHKSTSPTKFGWRHQIYRRVEVKRRELKKVGGIFMTYPAIRMWTWN